MKTLLVRLIAFVALLVESAAADSHSNRALGFNGPANGITITVLKGPVSINRALGYERIDGSSEVIPGDLVSVGAGGGAQLTFADGCTIRLEPGTAAAIPAQSPCASYRAPEPAALRAFRPVLVPVLGWSGCYLGGNFGGAWASSSPAGSLDRGTYLTAAGDLAAVSAAATSAARNGGLLGGGQGGCNWQTDSFVWGFEADLDGLGAEPLLTGIGILTSGAKFTITNSVKTSWLATLRPRVGVGLGHSLAYVTAGLALANVSYSQTYSDTFAAVGTASASATKAGWTLGAGWEYWFSSNWSTKVEYLFAQFSSVASVGAIAVPAGRTNVLHGSAGLRDNIVRAGVNYRFGG